MQPSDFSKDKAGQLIKASQGYWAFNPTPLPPPLTLTWELAGEISAADRALSELAGVARTLPNPHLLISPFIRREAVLSSRIRQRLGSFVRRTLSFSKTDAMHENCLRLFLHEYNTQRLTT